jgi:protein TonB
MTTPQNLAVMSMDDIVFAGRNQSYGAYVLRQSYNRVMFRALVGAMTVFTLALVSPLVLAKLGDNKPRERWTDVIDVLPPPIQEEQKVIVPPVTPPPPPAAPSIRYVQPVVVPDELADQELPPVMEDVKNSNPGQKTIEGDPNLEPIAEPEVDPVKNEVETPKTDAPFITVEIMPQYQGGMKEMVKFLQKNLKYPKAAERANIEGKVYVSFVIGASGEISQVQVIKGVGFGCDEEAVRVINKMPNWTPGVQGGRKVSVKYTLPISFNLTKE